MNYEIDTKRVIDEVRPRRCLWDAKNELYKNKDARNMAWNDIMIEIFGNVPEKEKYNLGKLIQLRWKTARDSFFKAKKIILSGNTGKKFKKYIFYDELSFLNSSDMNETDESLIGTKIQQVQEILPDIEVAEQETNTTYTTSLRKPRSDMKEVDESLFGTKIQQVQEILPDIEVAEQETNTTYTTLLQKPRIHLRNNEHLQICPENTHDSRRLLNLLGTQAPDISSDDLAFFISLAPILNNFDLQQKLEFRSRVIRDAIEVTNTNTNNVPISSTSPIDIISSESNIKIEPDIEYTESIYSFQTVSDYHQMAKNSPNSINNDL